MVKLLPAALALLLALPAGAEEAPNLDPAAQAGPGAVAQFLSAQNLLALGTAAKDPLMVVTAARMMRGLTLVPASRSADGAAEPAKTDLPSFDPATMIATAKTLDAGQNYIDLIESVARETPVAPKSLAATASTLAPGKAESWTLPFYGGTAAEVAVVGAGKSNLDFLVTDDKGHHICDDNGHADTGFCGFTPKDNGTFTVTVTNSGAADTSYTLITN